jgi:hypothetical protein
MRIGDVSRRRRLTDPVRIRWYAQQRAIRFARRMFLGCALQQAAVLSVQSSERALPCCPSLTTDN